MALLLVGLALFIGVHLVPSFAGLRRSLASGLGENGYKILFSLASIGGIVLVVIGYRQAPDIQIFEPSQTARLALPAGMAVAFILVAAAYAPGRIRKLLRHPMMAGTLIWSVLHLLANGDLAGNILFGAVALWSVFAILSAERRGKRLRNARASLKTDLVAVIVGLIAFAVVLRFHADLFGVAPI